MEEKVQFVGMDGLNIRGIARVREIAFGYHGKIERTLNNKTTLSVHVKRYKKAGMRSKYSVNAKAMSATRIFNSTKAHDWDLARTLHKAFTDLENQIEHKMHLSNQRPKRVGRNSPNPRKHGYSML